MPFYLSDAQKYRLLPPSRSPYAFFEGILLTYALQATFYISFPAFTAGRLRPIFCPAMEGTILHPSDGHIHVLPLEILYRTILGLVDGREDRIYIPTLLLFHFR